MTDTLSTLIFEAASARAHLVKLTDAWQRIVHNNPCPPVIQTLLGQLLAASTMLSASLKFDGSLILQIQGDGPVRLLVAECNSRLGVRATVKMKEDERVSNTHTFQQLVNPNGKGMFVLVLDPHNRQPGQTPYQGIVPLTGESVSEALQAYMHHSEQLSTKLILSANEHHAAGLMIQQMPTTGGQSTEQVFDPDGWDHLQAIAATLHPHEHLTTSVAELSTRLFWEAQPRQLSERQVQFECTCSRHKVERMLMNLGPEEVNAALEEKNPIEVNCDFCGSRYTFDQTQCDQVFLPDDTPKLNPGHTLH